MEQNQEFHRSSAFNGIPFQQRSAVRNQYIIALVMTLATGVAGCQTVHTIRTSQAEADSSTETSLEADRKSLDRLRQEIPEEKRRANDELALIREVMSHGEEEPAQVRERFAQILRRRREEFDRGSRQRRDAFSKKEKTDRESFLASLKAERENFMESRKKASADERRQFFDEQESKRKDFFSTQQEARKDFESGESVRRRDFESLVTEKNAQFSAELREYSANLTERRKMMETKKRAEKKLESKQPVGEPGASSEAKRGPSKARSPSVFDADLDQFKAIPGSTAIPLRTQGDK